MNAVSRKTSQLLAAASALLVLFPSDDWTLLAASLPSGCRADLIVASTASEQQHYKVRKGGLYCDGSAAVRNDGSVTLVSFMIGSLGYSKNDTSLKIVPVELADSTRRLILRGQDQRPNRSYRLDGPLDSDGLDLDLTASIHPLDIAAKDLGLYAEGDGDSGPEIWPVAVGTAPNNVTTATLVVRAPLPLVELYMVICELPSETCELLSVVASQIPAGDRVPLSIPRPSEPKALQITLTGLGANNKHYPQVFLLRVDPW